MREHERHRECDKIRCSEAIDVGNNETHHCLSLSRAFESIVTKT
jgi:hypothetical protein